MSRKRGTRIPVQWQEQLPLKAPRLATIAKWINANTTLTAKIERGFCDTDRKFKGSRLRWPGKGRWGNRLIVRHGTKVVLDHNSAETYRYNAEAVRTLADYLDDHPEVLR
jgi:hypothetical protein